MRIAFGDFSGWDFHVQSVETMPMGGSQSAACYLAQALARQGHEVFFLSDTTAPGVHGGVTCLEWKKTPPDFLRGLGLAVFVCLLGGEDAQLLRGVLGPETRLVLWTQHHIDQPAVESLAQPDERDTYDAFVFASEWQRAEFLSRFALSPERTQVLGNAVSPAFLDSFPTGQPILPRKTIPPVLAYTSTPYRGLALLIDAFPAIRAQVPEVRLRVFSSMQVYQTSAASDREKYGSLYDRCREIPGIEYVGSIPQPALAQEMRSVAVLAYPCIILETSCIAALEAMASGCRIVTSAHGALPETTAGFAELISLERGREQYLREFVERTVAVLRETARADDATEDLLQRQVRHIRQEATWEIRAGQWHDWLTGLCQQ